MTLAFPKKTKWTQRGRKLKSKTAHKTRRQVKASRYRKLRPETREAAWMADGMRCIFPTCRRSVSLADAHIHEVVFRSELGDPLDIDNTVTTCGECHGHIHVRVGGKLKRIEGSRASGLRFYQRAHYRDDWKDVSNG